ncbi:MAG: hypothetical protein ACI87O_001939 [Planctomycetota bacterium]|jgi:hypothetical protein
MVPRIILPRSRPAQPDGHLWRENAWYRTSVQFLRTVRPRRRSSISTWPPAHATKRLHGRTVPRILPAPTQARLIQLRRIGRPCRWKDNTRHHPPSRKERSWRLMYSRFLEEEWCRVLSFHVLARRSRKGTCGGRMRGTVHPYNFSEQSAQGAGAPFAHGHRRTQRRD